MKPIRATAPEAQEVISYRMADVPMWMLGLGFTVTPEVNGVRSIVRSILFAVCFYVGFIRKA